MQAGQADAGLGISAETAAVLRNRAAILKLRMNPHR
jgi:hypothetical protein